VQFLLAVDYGYAKPLFYEKGKVFVRPPSGNKKVNVAISPNSSFISGLAVKPMVRKVM
jgi:hypothetical protein